MVERLADKLVEEAQLNPFLDRWHLIPGEPWQESLEEALNRSRCVAVFVGPSGVNSWENEEMRAALSRRVQENRFRVIPVLLPGADQEARDKLPSFLLRFTWVDLTAGIDDPVAFSRLVAGIRGQAPGRSGVQKLSTGSPYILKSVREIMEDALRPEGIDLASIPRGLGATISMLIRRCQLQYPNLDPQQVAQKINGSRALAYEEKYAQRSQKEDERYRGFEEWETELHALLRHVGIRDFARCRAINVGIGNGLEKPFFYKDFKQLLGVDLSAKALARAAQVIANLATRRAEAEELEGVASNAFDLYLSLRTYQSTFFDIGDALFAACRVLASGGRVVISIPYVYVDQGRLLNGLLRPGGHDLDPDLPYEIADAVRRGLQNLGFEELGLQTGLFEIYIYGMKTS
ncbi:Methyltransferase type 11 [Candidatus Accumulibacter aalborgensis]|uniref:Methyltransferase type 11 n=2 Tax=Candidatus Accumulibacter aalborgensis TaxID=1860102 RepID=A0A1A8XR96_9PROT|nr:Methyltransferase type 11 [Candidatus Accumulibacter aalborgensis]